MNDVLVYLANKLDEEIKVIEGDLALGKAKDFGDYKFACGRYRGLLTAKGIIVETAQRMDNEDD
jgi:hypothetical protein